jgi:hypothetical protein
MVYECNRRQAIPVGTAVTLYWNRLLGVHHDSLIRRVTQSCVPIRSLMRDILSKTKTFRKRCAHRSVSQHYQQYAAVLPSVKLCPTRTGYY